MQTMYKDMPSLLEVGQVGNFKLKKFEITPQNRPFRCDIPNGKYIQLLDESDRWNGCVMSDTPMEKRTNKKFVQDAHGDVFIAGLGIGLIVLPIQEKEEVKSITILEKNAEVIELVGKQLPLNDKVRIVHGDVFEHEFPKGTKFDCLYFDIWNYVNQDVWEEMKMLKRRYLKYRHPKKVNPNVFTRCWAELEAKKGLPLR